MDADTEVVARLIAERRVEAAIDRFREAARELTAGLEELERYWAAEWDRDWQRTYEREQLLTWRTQLAPWATAHPRWVLWHAVPRNDHVLRVPLGTPPSAYPFFLPGCFLPSGMSARCDPHHDRKPCAS